MRSFIAKSYSSKINNNEHTMTSVSIAFRWAMLCTKSELRFRQYSFNHRIRNLRSIEVLRLTPYPSPQGCGCKSDIASKLQADGVTVMLAGNMGAGALAKLSACGIEVISDLQIGRAHV